MNELKVYKDMPEWTAQTLPDGFRHKHNTKEGTWARLTVREGALTFTSLTRRGDVLSTHTIDAAAGPRLIEPGAWHKVTPTDESCRCQLSFLCEPSRYLEKKYGLTAPHSEVRRHLPQLQAATGRNVLDLGSGRGRNSLFLAEGGFDVTAVDRSEGSIATLRDIQAAEGIDLASHVYDINDAALARVLPGAQVDHIVSTVVFQFLEAARVPSVIEDMQAVTRPGGLHLIVAPVTSDEVPCPIAFSFVFEEGALREHYRGWEILRYDEAMGEFHKRDEHGVRFQSLFATLLARKPNDT